MHKGILSGVLSALCVAIYITINKYIYSRYSIDALEYTILFTISGGLFAACNLSLRLDTAAIGMIRSTVRPLLFVSLIGATAIGVFNFGLKYTSAVNASLLMSCTIVTTALFSHIYLKERHYKNQYPWILLLFAGVHIGVVGFRAVSFRSGDLIILMSTLFFGMGNAYSRIVMKRMKSATLVPDVRLSIGGLLALPLVFFVVDDYGLVLRILPLTLLSGLFFWLTMRTFAKTVFLINANNAIVLNNAQMFFTSIAGVLLLAEHYTIEKFLGSLLAIIAIYYITRQSIRHLTPAE